MRGFIISLEKILWCSFRHRNWKVSTDYDALIRQCIELINNCSDISIRVDFYYIELKTNSTNIKLWNQNKWYSWLHRGEINGRKFQNVMPTFRAMFDFRKALTNKGYNLFPPEHKIIDVIDVKDIKC